MSEGKKNIIAALLQEYNIQSAEGIQDALKDLLGYESYERSDNPNSGNGYKQKQIRSKYSETRFSMLRDRDSTFEPKIKRNGRKTFLCNIYSFEVSEGMDSDITDYLLSESKDGKTDLLQKYLWKLHIEGKCVVNFREISRWWGTNPRIKLQEEIGIVGMDKASALFGECKWRNEKVDLCVFETLVERSILFHDKKIHFYLFARTGFYKGCADRATERGNVMLITYEDMMKA